MSRSTFRLVLALVLVPLVGACGPVNRPVAADSPQSPEHALKTATSTLFPGMATLVSKWATEECLATPTPRIQRLATATPVPAALTPSPVATIPLPHRDLSSSGPWLLAVVVDSVIAFNPDGTGQSTIISKPPVSVSLSPSGRSLAYITDNRPEEDDAGLQLRLVQLPHGPDLLITELQNPRLTSAEGTQSRTDPFDAMLAILYTSPTWSHNGKFIAYVGQQEGPTADLYVYSVAGGNSTRLTDGPSEAYHPSWSPDDSFIFHAGAWNFGTGAGYSNAGSWVVSRDGTVLVDTTTGNGSDEALGWQDSSRLIIGSWSQPCGLGFLRSYNLDLSEYSDIWPYYLEDFTYSPSTRQLLVAVPPDLASCVEGGQPTGLYLYTEVSEEPSMISDQGLTFLAPDPSMPDAFLLYDDNNTLYRLSPPNTLNALTDAPSRRYDYSPEVDLWLWYGDWQESTGLWVGGLLGNRTKIYEQAVADATWSPDGSAIIFLGEGDGTLYRAQRPTFEPEPVASIGSLYHWFHMLWAGG